MSFYDSQPRSILVADLREFADDLRKLEYSDAEERRQMADAMTTAASLLGADA